MSVTNKNMIDKDYKLIPMDDIRPEVREIAVRWGENMKDKFIAQVHKLASDIQNYSNQYAQSQQPTIADGWISFQDKVYDWLLKCFGEEISNDKIERNHRFLEESLELVQSLGCEKSEALQLVDYVFSRPIGEPEQEIGGVIVTLAALCSANKFNLNECGDIELKRIWQKIDKIREKQANKPKHSPLPAPPNKKETNIQEQPQDYIKVKSMWDLNNIYQRQFIFHGFETSAPVPEDRFPAIKKAIEQAINQSQEQPYQKEFTEYLDKYYPEKKSEQTK